MGKSSSIKNHQSYQSSNGNSYKIDGGKYTGYSASNENGISVYGFDSPSEVKAYIESQESGNDNSIDTLKFED